MARGNILSGDLVKLAEWESADLALMRAWGSFARGELARAADDLTTALQAFQDAFWSITEPGGVTESVFCAMQVLTSFDKSLSLVAMGAEAVMMDREKKDRLAELVGLFESRQRAAVKCHDCGEHVFAGYHQCRAADG